MGVHLATRLREATRELHVQVERAGVMRQLLGGRLDRPGYCRLLRNLHAIYQALEAGLRRHAGHPGLAPVFNERLFRTDRLHADLNALHGPRWAEHITIARTARAYVERLHSLADHDPALLAAHAYVRYLGDLSGGQVLAGIVAEGVAPDPATGRCFFDFGTAAEVAVLACDFRAGLDRVAADEAIAARVVDEARSAFERHGRLFEELAAAPAAH
jgi:heme oxygenase